MESHAYNGGAISSLWISNARRRRDAIAFICQASNRAGRDNQHAQVTLIDGKLLVNLHINYE